MLERRQLEVVLPDPPEGFRWSNGTIEVTKVGTKYFDINRREIAEQMKFSRQRWAHVLMPVKPELDPKIRLWLNPGWIFMDTSDGDWHWANLKPIWANGWWDCSHCDKVQRLSELLLFIPDFQVCLKMLPDVSRENSLYEIGGAE